MASKKSDHSSHTTTDHEEIRKWAEARGAKPACVKGTGGGDDAGLIRLDFPGYSGGDSLEEISWPEFFEKFEEQSLALAYQEETADGKRSNFNKLVRRDDGGGRGSKKSGGRHGREAK
jgi:hypothetical protein